MTCYEIRNVVRWVLCLAAINAGVFAASGDWNVLVEQGARLGMNQKHVAAVVEKMKAAGFSLEDAGILLGAAFEIRRQELPAAAVMLKIEEGLAKGVEVERLKTAIARRAQTTLAAARLVQETRGATSCEGGLVTAVACALESGLSEAVLRPLLSGSQDLGAGRMRGAMESGELLFLNGFSEEAAGQLASDFLGQQMRRGEMSRATRFAIEQIRQGIPPDEIRKKLWRDPTAQEPSADGAYRARPQREDSGQ